MSRAVANQSERRQINGLVVGYVESMRLGN